MAKLTAPRFDFYSVEDLAECLGITKVTVYKLIRIGKLKAIRLACGEQRQIYRILASSVRKAFPELFEEPDPTNPPAVAAA